MVIIFKNFCFLYKNALGSCIYNYCYNPLKTSFLAGVIAPAQLLFYTSLYTHHHFKTRRQKLHIKEVIFLPKSMKIRFSEKSWFHFIVFKYFQGNP